MMFLSQTYKLNSITRKVLIVLVGVLTITSVRVQSAQAFSLLPPAPTFSTATKMIYDVVAENGFTVPKSNVQELKQASEANDLKVKYTRYVDMTAYTSSVEECDSTPFITADGTRTEWGIVAANFLPFGTKIRIPEYFGDQVFVVHDRMNQRYYYRVDVWMQTKSEAFQFGKRKLKIEVLES